MFSGLFHSGLFEKLPAHKILNVDIFIEFFIEFPEAVWARKLLQAQMAPDMLLHVCSTTSLQFIANQTNISLNAPFCSNIFAVFLRIVYIESLRIAHVHTRHFRPSTFAVFYSRL